MRYLHQHSTHDATGNRARGCLRGTHSPRAKPQAGSWRHSKVDLPLGQAAGLLGSEDEGRAWTHIHAGLLGPPDTHRRHGYEEQGSVFSVAFLMHEHEPNAHLP